VPAAPSSEATYSPEEASSGFGAGMSTYVEENGDMK